MFREYNRNNKIRTIMKYFLAFIFFAQINLITLGAVKEKPQTKTKKTKITKETNTKNKKNTKLVKKSEIKNKKNTKLVKESSIKNKKKTEIVKNKKIEQPQEKVAFTPVKPTTRELNRYLRKNLKVKKFSSDYNVEEMENFFANSTLLEDSKKTEFKLEEDKIYAAKNQLGAYLYEKDDLKLALFLSPEGASYTEEENGEISMYDDPSKREKENSIFSNNKDEEEENNIELTKGVGVEYKF